MRWIGQAEPDPDPDPPRPKPRTRTRCSLCACTPFPFSLLCFHIYSFDLLYLDIAHHVHIITAFIFFIDFGRSIMQASKQASK